uniref:Uncharacterized protein n=1 Tax=Oryza nivara TaxID=4536 RepID=A0A0E0J9W9_ORYNI
MKKQQDDETTRSAHLQPLTKFLIPDGHVFVVDCAGDGDELTIHIKPRSDADADADADADDHLPPPIACGGAGKPSLFDGGWHRALFWSAPSPPDHQGAMVVPVPWAPPGITDDEINATLKTTAAASSVRLSPDTVILYWPDGEGNTAEVLVASMDYVGYVDVAGKPECRRAVSPLAQHAVLSTTPASFDTDDDGCVPRELGDDPQLMKRMHTSSS